MLKNNDEIINNNDESTYPFILFIRKGLIKDSWDIIIPKDMEGEIIRLSYVVQHMGAIKWQKL